MTGGTVDGYFNVLSMFCKDVENRLPLLQKAPETNTLSAFVTQVHALKSASASIGAAEVSALADKLEEAGKARDLTFIEENLNNFTKRLEELIKNIHKALSPLKGVEAITPESPSNLSVPILDPLLGELAEALALKKASSDILSILNIISQKQLASKTKEILERISYHVLMSEYENAVKAVEELVTANKLEKGYGN